LLSTRDISHDIYSLSLLFDDARTVHLSRRVFFVLFYHTREKKNAFHGSINESTDIRRALNVNNE